MEPTRKTPTKDQDKNSSGLSPAGGATLATGKPLIDVKLENPVTPKKL